MVYSVFSKPLQRRSTYRWLMDLAREAVQSNDINPTVNDVLTGVVAAEKAFKLQRKDEALDVASAAGRRVARLFKPEARRVFRMHDVDPRVVEAFEETAYRNTADRLRYSRADDHALILYTESHQHTEYAVEFSEFLESQLGFREDSVMVLADLVGNDFEEAPTAFAKSASELVRASGSFGNVVIYYSGLSAIDHVNQEIGGFVFANNVIPYKVWAAPLADHEGNIVFVNDTSFAAAANLAFKDLGLLPERAMVLSGCGIDEGGCENLFSKSVTRQYGNQEAYMPKKIEVHGSTVTVNPPLWGGRPFNVKLPRDLWTLHHTQNPRRAGAGLDYLLMKYPRSGL